ncbi:MAG TPA: glycosyltransferase family 1 protein [Candidatus Dormibacteraeota bacterium]|nr:glycosyltransferase family 1 protein [Candidatus Dormibacteraeota bacterium]
MARFAIDLTATWRPQRVGMVTVSIELAKALIANRGKDQYTILCSRERPPELEGLACEAVFAPYRHEVPLKTRWIPAIEPQLGCDAILYPYWPSPPLRRAGAPPAAVFVHDLAFRITPSEVPWQQRLYMGATLGRSLRDAAAILVPSEATKRDLMRFYRGPGMEEKTEVVPEGLTPAAPAGALPEGIEPGYVLAVGTIEPRKNYLRLLAAYRRLRSGTLPFIINGRPGVPQLVIAGRPGWAYGDTLIRIRQEPGVKYLGHVDEATLSALYESASVLAYPSVYEGFGLPLLEAMSRGLPAVIGSAGALPELADGAAIAVDPQNETAIAEALERLLAQPDLRSKLGEEGKSRAASYTWEGAAKKTQAVLTRIASNAARKVA